MTMNNFKWMTLAAGMALCLWACGGSSSNSDEPTPSPTPDPTPEPTPTVTFAKGADISWATEYESKGYKFYNAQGEQHECTKLMKELGLDAIRLRVWVDPKEHDNWCNTADVVNKAKRAKAEGMDVMIDFHYSDWWADPSKQNIPAAWANHSYEQMKSDVATHTKEVLNALKSAGVTPKWVQVGNETSNGMLWPMGQADKNPKQYAGLFAAGYQAVKEVFAEAIVIVHLDNGWKTSLYDWNLDILKNNGAKWDMIGMSVYPYWTLMPETNSGYTTADQVIAGAISNIKHVAERYNCDVMVVETGMQCADGKTGQLADAATLAAGKKQLASLIKQCRDNTNGRCKGVFYWEPECKPSQYALGAFTEDGKPTVIMDAFKE